MDIDTKHSNSKQANEVQVSTNVFDLDEFPSVTKKLNVTPATMIQMLEEYGNYEGTIEEKCREYNLKPHTFFALCRTYPEIRQLYRLAQQDRAEHLAGETLKLADDTTGDIVVQPDGRFTPNNANVRRSELRIKSRQYLMERYHPDKYATRTKVEQTTRALHLHAVTKLPPVEQLEDVGLDGLMDVQRSMRYGDTGNQQAGATRR